MICTTHNLLKLFTLRKGRLRRAYRATKCPAAIPLYSVAGRALVEGGGIIIVTAALVG